MSRSLAISAADLDQRATVQRRADGEDAVGQPLENWGAVGAERWCKVRPARGREFFAAGGTRLEADYVFAFRYDAALDLPNAALRVLWRGGAYASVAPPVNVEAGNHTIELVCSSGERP